MEYEIKLPSSKAFPKFELEIQRYIESFLINLEMEEQFTYMTQIAQELGEYDFQYLSEECDY